MNDVSYFVCAASTPLLLAKHKSVLIAVATLYTLLPYANFIATLKYREFDARDTNLIELQSAAQSPSAAPLNQKQSMVTKIGVLNSTVFD